MQFPTCTDDWLRIAEAFNNKWNFPHCLGAIDGKHVVMQAPCNSGSMYYNYKGTHSIVLLAVVDAHYKFIYVDVGCNGRISDGGVFRNCSLYQKLEERSLYLPEEVPLPNREMKVPYCFVADDAFAMKPYILKPYPHRDQPAPNRIFNYRISRARRMVENAFGIVANKFRVLRKPFHLQPNVVTDVVLAICALHNFLISEDHYLNRCLVDLENENHDVIPGHWREELMPQNTLHNLERGKQNNYSLLQKQVRDEFKEYFMTTNGEISWQYRHI